MHSDDIDAIAGKRGVVIGWARLMIAAGGADERGVCLHMPTGANG